MKKFAVLLCALFAVCQSAVASTIHLSFDIDPDNVPTWWTYTSKPISMNYQLGDTLIVEFAFSNRYLTVSDDDGVNFISPWLMSNASSHAIANASLSYRDLGGNLVQLPFTLANNQSCCGHLGGYRWDNFLAAGQSIQLQSFVAQFDVTQATVQPIIGHFFGLNGVKVTNSGTVPTIAAVVEAPAPLFSLAIPALMLLLRRRKA